MSRVFYSLDDEQFNRLFVEFRHSAYRLESLQRYDVSYEQDEFARFLAGESRGEFPGIAGWADTVRAAVLAGKVVQRVHVVREPLSDYVRFECAWAYEHTVEAGEDVRVIAVGDGEWPDGLPEYDYWLFDSSELVAMHYRPDGSFASAEMVDDPRCVANANRWRDLAVSRSISYREYSARLDQSTFVVVRG